MVDLRQSQHYADYIKTLGWKVEKADNIQVFIRSFGFFGAIAKIQRFESPANWEGIQEILKRNRVWMTKIEPLTTQVELPRNFKQDTWPMLASKTLRIDLKQSKVSIYNQFKKDCRYILRKLGNNHIVSLDQYQSFYEIWKKSSQRKNLWIPSITSYQNLIKSFGKNVFCITIDHQAGALILMHDSVAYYYYAGATQKGTKDNLPYLTVWECIQEAKKRKCSIWDFEGIFDPRFPNNDWKGFTHFKKSFGGNEIEFPGSFTRWI